jgi:hypothetical protein
MATSVTQRDTLVSPFVSGGNPDFRLIRRMGSKNAIFKDFLQLQIINLFFEPVLVGKE